VFIIAISYYFFEKLQLESETPIFQTRSFWIMISFLFYSAGTFFVYLLSKFAITDKNFSQQARIMYCTVTILKNILFCISVSIKTVPEEEMGSNKKISLNDGIFED
jgi:hypothetical protein